MHGREHISDTCRHLKTFSSPLFSRTNGDGTRKSCSQVKQKEVKGERALYCRCMKLNPQHHLENVLDPRNCKMNFN